MGRGPAGVTQGCPLGPQEPGHPSGCGADTQESGSCCAVVLDPQPGLALPSSPPDPPSWPLAPVPGPPGLFLQIWGGVSPCSRQGLDPGGRGGIRPWAPSPRGPASWSHQATPPPRPGPLALALPSTQACARPFWELEDGLLCPQALPPWPVGLALGQGLRPHVTWRGGGRGAAGPGDPLTLWAPRLPHGRAGSPRVLTQHGSHSSAHACPVSPRPTGHVGRARSGETEARARTSVALVPTHQGQAASAAASRQAPRIVPAPGRCELAPAPGPCAVFAFSCWR